MGLNTGAVISFLGLIWFFYDLYVFFTHDEDKPGSISDIYIREYWITSRTRSMRNPNLICEQSNMYVASYKKGDKCFFRGGIFGVWSLALPMMILSQGNTWQIEVKS